jgi:KTSC domain
MQQTFFESSALFRVNYDAVAGLLEVEFRDHTIYRYRGVSAEMHAALLGAESKASSSIRRFETNSLSFAMRLRTRHLHK